MVKMNPMSSKDRVLYTAKSLITANGSTTTLDIKNELRKNIPLILWNQDYISKIMQSAEATKQIPGLTYTDNGTYRTYSIPKTVAPSNRVTPRKTASNSTAVRGTAISKTKAFELMKDSRGRFFTVTFTKLDGTERTMNARVKKDDFFNTVGNVKLIETKSRNLRTMKPDTLRALAIGGRQYKIK